MTLTDLPQIERLSTAQKLQLLGELWDSIAADPKNVPVSEEERALLRERLEAHRQNPAGVLSLEEFKKRLNKEL